MNTYLDKHSTAESVRLRVREYMYHSFETQREKTAGEGLIALSPTLRGDVIHGSPHFAWLERVPMLRRCEDEFLVQLPQAMTANLYAPFELPEFSRFYVLNKGVVMHGGDVLVSGRWWGEDIIVTNPAYRMRTVARALSFIETYSIDRDTLLGLAASYPQTHRALRRR